MHSSVTQSGQWMSLDQNYLKGKGCLFMPSLMDFVREDVNNSNASYGPKGFHLPLDGLVLPLEHLNELPVLILH